MPLWQLTMIRLGLCCTFRDQLLTAVENGGAGRPNLVALVGEVLPSDCGCVAEEHAGAMPVSSASPSSSFGVLESVALPLGLQDVATVGQTI